jgi:hypothetical protein
VTKRQWYTLRNVRINNNSLNDVCGVKYVKKMFTSLLIQINAHKVIQKSDACIKTQ